MLCNREALPETCTAPRREKLLTQYICNQDEDAMHWTTETTDTGGRAVWMFPSPPSGVEGSQYTAIAVTQPACDASEEPPIVTLCAQVS